MDLVEFIGIIRKWKWMVLVVVVVVTAYLVVSVIRSPASYVAEAKVMPGLTQIASSNVAGVSLAQGGERVGDVYAELVTSQPVMQAALDKAGLGWPVERLRTLVSSSVAPNTPVIKIDVSDSDSQQAKLLANSVANAFVDYIKDASNSGAANAQGVVLKQLNDVNTQISAQNAKTQPDESMIKALQDRRDLIVKEYQDLLDQQANAADIRVVDPATTYSGSGMSGTQKVAIGLIISVVAGIVLAFVAEAVRKSWRPVP